MVMRWSIAKPGAREQCPDRCDGCVNHSAPAPAHDKS
jgi:hypothetical protein